MKPILWLVSLGLMASCGMVPVQGKPGLTQAPSKYRFDYSLTNAEPIALLRVFDDSGSTFLQFRNAVPDGLVVSAETTSGETVIPHETMGNYAILRGVYRQLSIPSATQPVVARKLGDIPPMANLGPVVLPKVMGETMVAMKQEAEIVSKVKPNVPPVETVDIRFARNSARIGAGAKQALKTLAEAHSVGAEIEIKVRPFYPNRRASVRLAKARAEAIRRELGAKGVAEDNVRIDWESGNRPLVAEVLMRSVVDPIKLSQGGTRP